MTAVHLPTDWHVVPGTTTLLVRRFAPSTGRPEFLLNERGQAKRFRSDAAATAAAKQANARAMSATPAATA